MNINDINFEIFLTNSIDQQQKIYSKASKTQRNHIVEWAKSYLDSSENQSTQSDLRLKAWLLLPKEMAQGIHLEEVKVKSKFEDELIKNVLTSQEYWRVEQLKEWGINPLHKACEHGDTKAVNELLKLKLNINAPDQKGQTPLHVAFRHGHIELGKHLIEQGAKLFLADKQKKTPLTYLAESGQGEKAYELFKAFCQKNNMPPVTQILLAASEPIFSYHVAEKGDLNIKDPNGDTALHRALTFPSPLREKVIKNLVEQGADLSIKDSKGNTPFHLALMIKPPSKEDILKLLIDKKSLNEKNNDGRTPMHRVLMSDLSEGEILSYLLFLVDQGAKLSIKNNKGETPLHVALQLRPIPEKVIQFLIDSGANVNSINNDGESCRWLINSLGVEISEPLARKKRDTEAGLRRLLANVWTINRDTQMGQKTYLLEGGRGEIGQREVIELLKKLQIKTPQFNELEQVCDLLERGYNRSKKKP